MKKVLLGVLTLFLFLTPSVSALVSPTKEFYVNDYANILDEETENYIVSTSKDLYTKTGAQIVVVTITNLEGKDIESYATSLFRQFKIGSKKENNGLLLLIDMGTRTSRVEVGYGLEGILPDGLTGRIQDKYMIPYFKKDDFNNGMLNGYKAFYNEIATYYQLDLITDIKTAEEDQEPNINDIMNTIFCIIVVITIILILINRRRGYGGIYYGGGSFGGGSFGGGSSFGGGGSSGGGGSTRGF